MKKEIDNILIKLIYVKSGSVDVINNINNNLLTCYNRIYEEEQNYVLVQNNRIFDSVLFFRPAIIEASYNNSYGEVEALSIELKKKFRIWFI